jgi:hypothetical protein
MSRHRREVVVGVVSALVTTALVSVAAFTFQHVRSAVDPTGSVLSVDVTSGPTEADEEWGLLCDSFRLPDGVSPTEVPPPSDSEGKQSRAHQQAWVSRTKAADVGSTQLEIRIQGKDDSTVVLNDLKVVVDSTAEATTTVVYEYASECGAGYATLL